MAVYWLSFRLENDKTYNQRYDKLMELIKEKTVNWLWDETSSFIVFDTDIRSIDSLAVDVKSVIDPYSDTVIIGRVGFNKARLVGVSKNNNIARLMEFIRSV